MDLALNLASSHVAALSAVSGVSGVSPVAGGGAGADDAARFAQLMAQPAGADASATAGPPAVTAAPAATDRPASLGDAILNRLGSIGEGYAGSVHDLQASIRGVLGGPGEKAELGVGQVLALQLNATEWSVRVDVITKITQQTGQHINELGKLQ